MTTRQRTKRGAGAKADSLIRITLADAPALPWLDTIADPTERVNELATVLLRTLAAVRDLNAIQDDEAKSLGVDRVAALRTNLAGLLALGVALRTELLRDRATVARAFVAAREAIRVGERSFPSAHVAVIELAASVLRGMNTHSDMAFSREAAAIGFRVDVARIADVLRNLDVAVMGAALDYEREHALTKSLGRASQRDAVDARAGKSNEDEAWRTALLTRKGTLRKTTQTWLCALSEPAASIEEIQRRADQNCPRNLSAPLQRAGLIENPGPGLWRRTERGAAALKAGRV